ncbi:aminoglycoside phosphotransferase family protein [Arthrobacter sp. ISL-28]|uniref:aminoglycoside phosphotransferase family protein n=1 Tax=Arthrobacter sp. ISL-28 TaxID=2819108 RepID=UPI001BE8CA17|nr:aminoglycoside phosphotransferase family protein [Arthrobacter sp. ISL-28]MBT2520809.1 phosphotransferase [Arthrobacter sp. ISL-28]
MTAGIGAVADTPADDSRAERIAIAETLLASPPPLDALPPGPSQVLTRSVVHASRSRPVVRWTVTLDSGTGPSAPLAVIGKGYRVGGGEQAWRLLRSLRHAGFDDPELRVPTPYGFDPTRQLLAQEEAPSTTLHSLLTGDPRLAAPEAGRAGRWLARLHDVRGVHVPDLPVGFERLKLTEYAAALAGLLPQAAVRLGELTAGTLEGLVRAGGARVVTHGDFQPKNIHLDRHCIVVIDFDRAALAPAARDLGHFIGQTLTMGASRHGSLGAAAPWVDAFLDGYSDGGGDAGAVRSAPAYVARTFAEVLFYRLVVRPVRNSWFVPDWLDAWEAAVEAAAGGGYR